MLSVKDVATRTARWLSLPSARRGMRSSMIARQAQARRAYTLLEALRFSASPCPGQAFRATFSLFSARLFLKRIMPFSSTRRRQHVNMAINNDFSEHVVASHIPRPHFSFLYS